jgi:hypothetical protein
MINERAARRRSFDMFFYEGTAMATKDTRGQIWLLIRVRRKDGGEFLDIICSATCLADGTVGPWPNITDEVLGAIAWALHPLAAAIFHAGRPLPNPDSPGKMEL